MRLDSHDTHILCVLAQAGDWMTESRALEYVKHSPHATRVVKAMYENNSKDKSALRVVHDIRNWLKVAVKRRSRAGVQ